MFIEIHFSLIFEIISPSVLKIFCENSNHMSYIIIKHERCHCGYWQTILLTQCYSETAPGCITYEFRQSHIKLLASHFINNARLLLRNCKLSVLTWMRNDLYNETLASWDEYVLCYVIQNELSSRLVWICRKYRKVSEQRIIRKRGGGCWYSFILSIWLFEIQWVSDGRTISRIFSICR